MSKFDWIALTILEIVVIIAVLMGIVALGVLLWKLLVEGGIT